MPTKLPRLPLPPPILSDVPGTWAYDTMSRRVRTDIIARVFRENTFAPAQLQSLKALDAELEKAHCCALSFIQERNAPDTEVWNELLKEAVDNGYTWLSAPWILAEFYLYRRIMGAINYFENRVDPFEMQKQLGLSSALDSIVQLATRVNTTLEYAPNTVGRETHFQSFVLTALWGNRMDLSIWPVGGKDGTNEQSSGQRAAESFANVLEQGQKMILANHMPTLCEYARLLSGVRMDIVVDNAGFELFCDLCLADFLVCSGMASQVFIQLKAHPTFVSDAMEKDVRHTISFFQSLTGPQSSGATLGNRWSEHIQNEKWILTENFFWVQPQPMWDMPSALKDDMQRSALVFVKGDANYRRLIGERAWPLDTPFEDILCYFPAPVCALRTLKAELGCGMPQEATRRAASEDDGWLVKGKYGVVQFCDTRF